MNEQWKEHSKHKGFKYARWKSVPEEARERFSEPGADAGTTVLAKHDEFDDPIAMINVTKRGGPKEVLFEKSETDIVLRDAPDAQVIVITPDDEAFIEAYKRGISCALVRNPGVVPAGALNGRKVILTLGRSRSEEWVDHLYNATDDVLTAIWTAEASDFDLLAEGYSVEEVCGRPEVKPAGEVSPLPGSGPTYVRNQGVLSKVSYNDDEEKEFVPLLNCYPRPVDRIRERGEVFFTVCLEQDGRRSDCFDLIPEISTSYQEIMKAMKRVGSPLPRPPANIAGKQTWVLKAFDQVVHAQWPAGVPEAVRPGHWGQVSIEGAGEDVWLFADHVFVPGQGLREVQKDEVYVDGHRVKATPNIDQPGPVLSTEEASIHEVEDVISRAHGQMTANLVTSYISYCASKVLPTAQEDNRHLAIFVGPKGSGKTTTGKLLLACFGQDPDEMVSISGSTEAGVLAHLGAYRELPVGLDEYKNDSVSKRKNALLRQAYDKGTIKKGTVNRAETEDHQLHGIPLLIGEHEPNDNTGALLDRGLILDFDNDFEEDTYEETVDLMKRASNIAPQLYNQFVEYGDEAFRELRSRVKREIGTRLEEHGFPGVGRRVDLYSSVLASREVIIGDLDQKIDGFVEHLAQSLDRVEQSAVHIRFFQTLTGYAAGRPSTRAHFARVMHGTELRLAATLSVSAYEEQAGRQRSSTDTGQQDILNHLKNFDGSWFLDANVNTRFESGQKKAWCIDLDHPDVPEAVLEFAQYAEGELDESLYEDRIDGSEEDGNS